MSQAHEPGPEDARQEQLSDTLHSVWARTRDGVLARVDLLEESVPALMAGTLPAEDCEQARRAAHKLAGSAGMFGFAEASRVAGALEKLLEHPVEATQGRRAAEQILRLRELLEPIPGDESPPSGDPTTTGVLLLSNDRDLAAALHAPLGTHGLAVTAAGDRRRARALVERQAPAAVLVDGRWGDDPPAPATASASEPNTASEVGHALSVLAELELTAGQPALLLTDADRQIDRVAAVRAGVAGFLSRELPGDQVAQAVAEALHHAHGDAEHILACDDDPAVLEAIHAVLEASGLRVTTLSDPRGFWSTLEAANPDLVLLDVDMPHVDGLELCRTLRATPQRAVMPVMFLTGHTDRPSVQQTFAAGADDVVAKPLVADELRARVDNRLARMRLLRRMAEVDALTTLSNRRACHYGVQRQLAMAERHHQPLAFALLDLDHFKQVNDRHGHAVGDAVLKRLGGLLRARFRASDIVARWGGEELVVAMHGMGRHDGVQRIAEALEELRQERFHGAEDTELGVTFSAGIAQYPDDGDSLHELYLAADAALARAKHLGRDRVVTLDPRSQGEAGRCEVLCVEDDEAVGGRLLLALRTRGYAAEWLCGGQEARRRLTGPEAGECPRVVLLNVDLPALDGLELLATLQRAGRLAHTRVVALTAQSDGYQIRQAMGDGAVDCVTKPVSVALLLERVRHALSA